MSCGGSGGWCIRWSGNDFLVYVPDMEIYTEGKDFADAIEMARDAIVLKGIDLEDDGIWVRALI